MQETEREVGWLQSRIQGVFMRGPMIHRETVSTGEVEWFEARAILDRSSAGYGLAVGINGKGSWGKRE